MDISIIVWNPTHDKKATEKAENRRKNENKEKTLWLANFFLNENWEREHAFNIRIILEKKGYP